MIPFAFLWDGYGVVFLNCFFGALLCTLFFVICCNLGFRVKTSLALTLAFGFSTLIFPYTKFLWDNIESCFFVLLAFYFFQKFISRTVLRGTEVDSLLSLEGQSLPDMVAGLLSAAIACLIRPPGIIAFVLLGLFFFIYANKKQRLGLICLTLFIATLGLAYNYYSYGHVMGMFAGWGLSNFATMFHDLFPDPSSRGLYGLYLSFGKSFFIYSPLALLGIFGFRSFYKNNKPLALLSLFFIVCHSVFYSKVRAWSGDHCWGPRYLLELVPFFIRPCGYLLDKDGSFASLWMTRAKPVYVAFVGLTLLGFFINLPAILIHPINITYQYWFDYKIQNNFQHTYQVDEIYSQLQLSPVYLSWKAVFDVGHRMKSYKYDPFTTEDQRDYAKTMRNEIKENHGVIRKSALEPFLKKDLGYNVFYFWWLEGWIANNYKGSTMRPFVLKFLAILLSLFFLSSYLLLNSSFSKQIGHER